MAGGPIGLAEDEQRIRRVADLLAALRLFATGLESETAPFSPARVMARLAGGG